MGVENLDYSSLNTEVSKAISKISTQKSDQQLIIFRITINVSEVALYIDPYTPPWKQYTPIKACIYPEARIPFRHKTTNALVSVAARKKVTEMGFNEAILVDESQFVREGAWSNLFWVDKKNKVHTPKSGMLPGITRQAVMECVDVIEDNIRYSELISTAKEIFITQATTGVTPVSQINEVAVGDGRVGDITLGVMEVFEKLAAKNTTQIILQ